MKKSIIVMLSILLTSMGVYAQETKEDKKALKKETAEREIQKSNDLVTSGSFTFVALQAAPIGGTRRFLNTVPNYVHIDQEEGDIYLPYYGVVHTSNGYSAEAGIKYKGKLDNYKLVINDKKQSMKLSFEARIKNELVEFNFDVYKGGATTLVLASSRRKAINYYGQFRELEMPLTN